MTSRAVTTRKKASRRLVGRRGGTVEKAAILEEGTGRAVTVSMLRWAENALDWGLTLTLLIFPVDSLRSKLSRTTSARLLILCSPSGVNLPSSPASPAHLFPEPFSNRPLPTTSAASLQSNGLLLRSNSTTSELDRERCVGLGGRPSPTALGGVPPS